MELAIAQFIAGWRTAIELFLRTKAGKNCLKDISGKEYDIFSLLLEALIPIASALSAEERATVESWKKYQNRIARSTFFIDTEGSESSEQDERRFDELMTRAHAQIGMIEKIAKQREQMEHYGSVRTPMVPISEEACLPRSERMTMPHYYDPEYLRSIARQVEEETGRDILMEDTPPSEAVVNASREAIPPPPGSVAYQVQITSSSDAPEAPPTKTSEDLASSNVAKNK